MPTHTMPTLYGEPVLMNTVEAHVRRAIQIPGVEGGGVMEPTVTVLVSSALPPADLLLAAQQGAQAAVEAIEQVERDRAAFNTGGAPHAS